MPGNVAGLKERRPRQHWFGPSSDTSKGSGHPVMFGLPQPAHDFGPFPDGGGYRITQKAIREGKRLVKKQGPCLICGRVPFAYHRLFDAELGMLIAGESLESVALEYGEDSIEDMVARWRGFLECLYDLAAKAKP